MKSKYLLLALVLSFCANDSFADVLQVARQFLSLYDAVSEKIHKDREKYDCFLERSGDSGVEGRIEVIRMMHATMLSKRQPHPTEPLAVYLKEISKHPIASATPSDCLAAMDASGKTDSVLHMFKTFKEYENPENVLKAVLLGTLEALNTDPFLRICAVS